MEIYRNFSLTESECIGFHIRMTNNVGNLERDFKCINKTCLLILFIDIAKEI